MMPTPSDRSTQRAALLSILGFWLLYVILNSVRMAAVGAAYQWPMAGRRVAVALVGVLLSLGLYAVLRPLDRSRLRRRVTAGFLASAPVAAAYAAFNYFMFYVYLPLPNVIEMQGDTHGHMGVIFNVGESVITWYFFILAWALLYISFSYSAQVQQAERRAARYQAEAQAAQLRALRYQLNPHFLFNTLNSLSALVLRRNGDEAERMIMTLSAFLRTTLATEPTEDVTLAEELRVQRLYLDIEQVRFPERLRVDIDIPEALETALVPALLLQPLIENAIKYGVSRTSRPVTIRIRAREAQERLHLRVEDDGDLVTTPCGGHGVGLRNVCDRLVTRFDDSATCVSFPLEEGGFRVDLTLPLQKDG